MAGVLRVRLEKSGPRHKGDDCARDKRAYKYKDVTRHEMRGGLE